jgi:hypothetical protein
MTEKMFEALLARSEATASKRGPATLPEGRTITLYVGRAGAALQIPRVAELRLQEALVEARNHKGELFLVALEDVYAASISAEGEGGGLRKAGFVG